MDDVKAADRPVTGAESGAPIRAEFVREGRSLFWLVLGHAWLTVVTLGIWRFWMTTRLRRHYWSSIRIMGDPFEYTGTGLEKLVGFLLAVIILAVYLTIVNFAFVFVGLYSTDDVIGLQVAINLSVVASLPLIHFAIYRARRYVMARTRWRGIRFGMEQAAWGYAWRAVGLTALTVITLGLLYPFQQFRLSKFMTDRTWFGDRRFLQRGNWRVMLRYWAWVYLGAGMLGGALVVISAEFEDPDISGLAGLIALTGYVVFYLLLLRYRVASFRYLWDNRTLGETRFRNDVDTGEVIGVTVVGSAGVLMLAALVAFVVVVAAATVAVLLIGPEKAQALLQALQAEKVSGPAYWWVLGFMALGYLTAVPFGMAFDQLLLVRPILARQVDGLRIADAAALGTVRQRDHDHAMEAGGFADALGVDIGSGF